MLWSWLSSLCADVHVQRSIPPQSSGRRSAASQTLVSDSGSGSSCEPTTSSGSGKAWTRVPRSRSIAVPQAAGKGNAACAESSGFEAKTLGVANFTRFARLTTVPSAASTMASASSASPAGAMTRHASRAPPAPW